MQKQLKVIKIQFRWNIISIGNFEFKQKKTRRKNVQFGVAVAKLGKMPQPHVLLPTAAIAHGRYHV